MKNYDDLKYGVDYKDDSSFHKFFSKIKAEYLKNLSKVYILTMLLIITYIAHLFLISLYNQIYIKIALIQIITVILFSVYLIIYFSLLSYTKFCPTLVKFLKKELHYLGYKTQKRLKIDLYFFIFIFFSFIILIFINIRFYLNYSNFTTSLIIRLIIIYMILGISLPILRGVLHDKLIVKLRKPYFIQLELQIKLIKRKEIESQMVRIYMTSNKLGLKSDQDEFDLYKEISEKKWLPKKGRFAFQTFLLNFFLYFHEYATPINFKEHFLNLVSAIREWDIPIDHKKK